MVQILVRIALYSVKATTDQWKQDCEKIGDKREDAGRTRFLPAFIMKKLFVEQLTDICFLFKMQETDSNKFFIVPLLHLMVIV